MNDQNLWRAKLAARIHDPAEKALVLLRDPAGHEGGTSRALNRLMSLNQPIGDTVDPDNDQALASVVFKKGLPADTYRHVQRADWWAAAADRPQWPMEEITVTTKAGELKAFSVAPWAQVRWTNAPTLIHPLTGQTLDLPGGLAESDFHDIKERSFNHHADLLIALGAEGADNIDLRQTTLAYWRFGPELSEENDNGKLGALWRLLPADTRIPDHSIWDHLDLTSAFAGAFAGDPKGEAALLTVSLGPVQSFIAAARSTSDLWAGSHLLSRLAWEAMKPVCEQLGPDAVLFPRLRGIPQVDLWLRDDMLLPAQLFKDCEWQKGATDANPLFSAALPNRFVAVVPASQAQAIAERVTQTVRDWLQDKGQVVVNQLLQAAGLDTGNPQHCHQQMREQLTGFPEVHWAAVPFALINPRNVDKQTDLDLTALSSAMAPFFGVQPGKPCGFLDSPAWQVLQKNIQWNDKTTFFAPNPGALYPAVFDLAERALAAAKASRTFEQAPQNGWRCSLTGETEWLTTEPAQLQKSYRQQTDTLWSKVASKKPSWAKKGEHLGGLSALKRLWPTLFAAEVGQATGKPIGRFVVSTHTMALASQLEKWLADGAPANTNFADAYKQHEPESVALPRRLMKNFAHQPNHLEDAKVLPGLLDAARDQADDGSAYTQAKQVVQETLGVDKLETYYSLIMMDGDRMGAILSGDEKTAISYRDSFHPQVRKGFDERASKQAAIQIYGQQKRAITPNRHLAISGALNDFSQTVVRHVVEEEHLGRVIYAGGDDVLAMLPVADMLSAMQRLQQAYGGHDSQHTGGVRKGLTLRNGFAAIKVGQGDSERLQLMRMMGQHATSSCGAVIAHHQAPLASVLQELRNAEKRAKNEGGRDAFAITVIKRSGGTLYLTAKWGEPMQLLKDSISFLRADGTSRRAVHNTLEWLRDLPQPNAEAAMLSSVLAFQLSRQASDNTQKAQAPELAKRLAQLCAQHKDSLNWLANFLSVSEFLAREIRS
jgi:CRISPR-associated protein Cmr2